MSVSASLCLTRLALSLKRVSTATWGRLMTLHMAWNCFSLATPTVRWPSSVSKAAYGTMLSWPVPCRVASLPALR
uniref:Putative secreted protein n=1 Tax=Ixodes ricinus TaxID=34613 RepID=A0A6B0U1Y4_IXORI